MSINSLIFCYADEKESLNILSDCLAQFGTKQGD